MTDINVIIGTSTPINVTIDKTGPRGLPGGAPPNASYITTASEAGLDSEKVLGDDIVISGLAVNKPAASIAGRVYIETDGSKTIWRDNGASWDEITRYTDGVYEPAGIADATKAQMYMLMWEVGSERIWPSNTMPTVPTGAGGWLVEDGRTLGDSTSGANLIGLGFHDLFVYLWNNSANTELAILNSDGTPGVRGASAQADWDAHKRMPLPDSRDKAAVGYHAGDADFGAMLKTGGEKAHMQTVSELVSHTHVQDSHNHTQNAHSHNVQGQHSGSSGYSHNLGSGYYNFTGIGGSSDANTATNNAATATNQNIGGGQPFNILQPFTVRNFIIKY